MFAAALMLLAIAPAGAMARHGRHHRSRHHARIERFGTDVSGSSTNSGTNTSSTAPTSSNSAGTIQSFDGTTLVIALNDGSTVSGAVTNDTECSTMSSSSTHEDGDGGSGGDNSSGSGDQSGSNDQSSGSEDQGGGDDQNEGNDQEDENNACTTSNLTPGAAVSGAELRITSSGNVWKDVELAS